jgi:hypothetical protein
LADAVAVASEEVVTQAASVQFQQSPRSLASEQASSNETQQWEPTEQQKNAFDTVMEEFRLSSQHVAEAIATLKNSGFAKAFVNFFSNAGEHIQPSFSGAVTDVGGPVISLGQGMLNPDVAKGTKSIYDQYKDPNHVSHGDQYCATGLFPEECPPAQAQPTPSTQGRGSAPQ